MLRKVDPKTLEFAPIGDNIARQIKTPELKDRVAKKFNDEGMFNSVVVADSPVLGVGCGKFEPGSSTKDEVPVLYEEVLAVLEGSATLTSNGESQTAQAGEFFHIEAGTKVKFASKDGCRLLFITSPAPWVAFEEALLSGKLK